MEGRNVAAPDFKWMGLDWTFWFSPTEVHAYQISVISCILSLLAFLVGIVAYALTSSPSILGFCFENAVDLLSSVIVAWRFWLGNDKNLSEEKIEKMERKEKRASISIAFILFLLGVVVASVAIDHLITSVSVTDEGLLVGISVPCFLIFGFLAAAKWRMAKALKSPAFVKDAMCSAFGATLSFSVFFSSAIGSSTLDGVVAIIVAIICMWAGLRTLLKDIEQEWWTMKFWREEGLTWDENRERKDVEMRESGGNMAQRNSAYDFENTV